VSSAKFHSLTRKCQQLASVINQKQHENSVSSNMKSLSKSWNCLLLSKSAQKQH